jgi:hypothetical protein
MKIYSALELAPLLRFSPRPDRAVDEGALVFTIFEVEQMMGEGRVDGDGLEQDLARRVKRPARIADGQTQGWWELAAGVYHVSVNERLAVPAGALLILQPHPALTANGVWHLPLTLRSEKELEQGVMLVVSGKGVRIREGSPVSRGIVVA